jgi:molybdopterin-guanine dinucleotide biosynthesis protein A
MSPRLAGIILCGGESRRMGMAKASLDFHGTPLLTHMVTVLSRHVTPVVVVASPEQELPELPDDVLVVRDRTPFQGPLAGLVEGLSILPRRVTWAYVTAVDMPCLVPGWIPLLHRSLGDSDIAVPKIGDRLQPLAALYHCRVAETARRLLSCGRRSLRELCAQVRLAEIQDDTLRTIDPNLVSLRSANTPEEWSTLLEQSKPG